MLELLDWKQLDRFYFISIDKYVEVNDKMCDGTLKPIENSEKCKAAAEWMKKRLPESNFVEASGDGSDLPHGCIFDKVSGTHHIYWNDNNKTVISKDPDLKLICHNKAVPPSRKYELKGLK